MKADAPLLAIEDLHVAVDGSPILRGVDLTTRRGEIHALMGPNGSGKSTLAKVLMGHPAYEITAGRVYFDGEDITEADPPSRGRRGMFLAFQYPEEIPGVSVVNFLRTALSNRTGIDYTVLELRLRVMDAMAALGMDSTFADRYVNQGFSGGERKRNEVLQMAVLEPELAIRDETDSGLDIDALQIVAEGVNRLAGPERDSSSSPTTSGCSITSPRTPSMSWSTAGSLHRAAGVGPTARSRRLRGLPGGVRSMIDPSCIRADFPILDRRSTGDPSYSSTRRPVRRSRSRFSTPHPDLP